MSKFILPSVLVAAFMLNACKEADTPEQENPEEIIDKIQLLFAPADDSDPLVFTATDPDADGPEDMVSDGDIVLKANTEYELFITITNTVSGEDVSDEIEEESDVHMIFFEFTDGIFYSPAGDGNLDSRSDLVNYLDEDDNGLPVGLITSWITGDAASGTFRMVLKHQPDVKSATSESTDGETDVDFEWNISFE